jgi:hypothetical protein
MVQSKKNGRELKSESSEFGTRPTRALFSRIFNLNSRNRDPQTSDEHEADNDS